MVLGRLKEFSYNTYIILRSQWFLFRKTNFKIRNQRDKEYNNIYIIAFSQERSYIEVQDDNNILCGERDDDYDDEKVGIT